MHTHDLEKRMVEFAMAKGKIKSEHADVLDLIGYGLAKYAGPQKGTNEIANYMAKNRSAFFQRIVSLGLASSTNAVSNRQDNFDPFEPTRFVYAFFAFNTFYSFNWSETLGKMQLIRWEFENDITQERKSESQKIRELRKFIYYSAVKNELSQADKVNSKKYISKKLQDKLNDFLQKDREKISISLEGIKTDSLIDEFSKESFIIKLDQLMENKLTGKEFNDAFDTVLNFVFRVRNNIFHGSKTVLDMNKSQQERLSIYTSILLAVNEMLFDAIEESIQWSRTEVLDNYNKKSIQIKDRATRNFFSNSIRKKFDVEIPKGPLFYPCCGDDTGIPIQLFFDSIEEFYFVDSRLLPILPEVECKVSGFVEGEIKRSSRAFRPTRYSREFVSDVYSCDPEESSPDQERINSLLALGIKPAGFQGQNTIKYKQEWTLGVLNNKKLEVIRCIQDGLVSLLSLDNIAVFYLRRDSDGEGGSGQKWFKPDIFGQVLNKLMDGGLIITDGSSIDKEIYEVSPFKPLSLNHFLNKEQRRINPPADFTYENYNFRWLGECGSGYGPVYAWQVTKA